VNAPPPLVSVILPTHNRPDLLKRAAVSVLAQSEQRLELIVVDDASNDATPHYLEHLAAEDPRVRVVRNLTPRGGGGARNDGVQLSRARWLAFIDDDDEWLQAKLERQLQVLRSNPAAVACSCSYIVHSLSGASRIVAAKPHTTVQELLAHNWLGGASMCVCSREALRQIGGFDDKLRAGQDLDLWVRLRQLGPVVVCAEPLALHRAHVGPRITTNSQSQYLGVRRFYLKHRALMSASTRRERLSNCCFVMSLQATRPLRHRLRYLLMAVRHASIRFSLAFLKKSAPRLARDALRAAPRMTQRPAA
jgi:glycosyltransferase involved in cell wall biosynthesis